MNGSGPSGNGAVENLINANNTNTLSGTIVLQSSSAIGADAGTTLNLTGVVSGPGDLIKVGAGTANPQATNTYTGQTIVNNGLYTATAAGSLSSIVGAVVVNSGASLQVQGTITITDKTVTLNGLGFGMVGSVPRGALYVSVNNANVWAGNIILNTNSAIGAISGGTLTVDGIISGANNLAFEGGGSGNNGQFILNASNTWTGSTTVNGGTVILEAANLYTGATIINSVAGNATYNTGTLTLQNLVQAFGTSLGTIQSSVGITVNPNAVLSINDTGRRS